MPATSRRRSSAVILSGSVVEIIARLPGAVLYIRPHWLPMPSVVAAPAFFNRLKTPSTRLVWTFSNISAARHASSPNSPGTTEPDFRPPDEADQMAFFRSAVTRPGSGGILSTVDPGVVFWVLTNARNEPARRFQMVSITETENHASAERSPSPQTPHRRATDARLRGIKFPISYARVRLGGQGGGTPR